jgi:MoxR-like ATPase
VNDIELRATQLAQARHELARVIVGQERMTERVMACLLAGGHALLEGVPGLGKTLTLATLARIVGGTFNRIQFTSDMIPADIVGTRIYRMSDETFDIEPGPVFANIVLADEINRAPAKVQSALLEVMGERQVTIGGRTMPVPTPFLVVATQNPIESEGVYPLPEAQRDRFLMRIPIDYPTPAEEREIVHRMEIAPPVASRLLGAEDVAALQELTTRVIVEPAVAEYALSLVLATRDPAAHGVPELGRLLEYGASPRASIGLVRGARAMALLRGRMYATAQDVYDIAYDVLNGRLILSYAAIADGRTVGDVLYRLLTAVKAPYPVVPSMPPVTAPTGPVIVAAAAATVASTPTGAPA